MTNEIAMKLKMCYFWINLMKGETMEIIILISI